MRYVLLPLLISIGLEVRAQAACEEDLLRRHLARTEILPRLHAEQADIARVEIDAGPPSGWRALLKPEARFGYAVVPPEGRPLVFERAGSEWAFVVPRKATVHVYRDGEPMLMSLGGVYHWVGPRPLARDARLRDLFATYRAELDDLIGTARKFTPEDFLRARVYRGRLLERELDVLVVPSNFDRRHELVYAFDARTKERLVHPVPSEVHRNVALDDGRFLFVRPAGADPLLTWIRPGGARELASMTSSTSAKEIFTRFETPFECLASTLTDFDWREYRDAEALELRSPYRAESGEQDKYVFVTRPSGSRGDGRILAVLDAKSSTFLPIETFKAKILIGRPGERFAVDRVNSQKDSRFRLAPLAGESERLQRALERIGRF